MLDVLVLSQALVATVVNLALVSRGMFSFSYIRMLRLLRLGRFYRIMGWSALRDLHIIVSSVTGSSGVIIWSMAVATLMAFIFAQVTVQQLNGYIGFQERSHIPVDERWLERVGERFGSIWRATVTLLMCGCSGMDGGKVFDILKEAGGLAPVAFVAFVLCFNGAVVHIIAACLFDKVLHRCSEDREKVDLAHTHRVMEGTARLRHHFFTQYDGHDGHLTAALLKSFLEDEVAVSHLAALGIEATYAQTTFDMIPPTASGVFIDDFVSCCLRMNGASCKAMVYGIGCELKLLRRELREAVVRSG